MDNNIHGFLVLALMGYIVGYVIKPIARYFLLIKTSVFLFGHFIPHCKYLLSRSNEKGAKLERTKKVHKKLVRDLMKKNQSKKFTRIRELAPRNAQYIQFWDMHITMSHNLAFACITFLVIQLINCSLYGDLNIVIFLIIFISFIVLLYLSLYFSFWWKNDIKKTFKLTKDQQ